MALLFFGDVIAPAQCARDRGPMLWRQAATTRPPCRMGLHSGLVQSQIGHRRAADRTSSVRASTPAQRVMDFGDAGHILLSAQYALWLKQFDDWTPLVHALGEGAAKHGQTVQLYSLHGPKVGQRQNAHTPRPNRRGQRTGPYGDAPARGPALSPPSGPR